MSAYETIPTKLNLYSGLSYEMDQYKDVTVERELRLRSYKKLHMEDSRWKLNVSTGQN